MAAQLNNIEDTACILVQEQVCNMQLGTLYKIARGDYAPLRGGLAAASGNNQSATVAIPATRWLQTRPSHYLVVITSPPEVPKQAAARLSWHSHLL